MLVNLKTLADSNVMQMPLELKSLGRAQVFSAVLTIDGTIDIDGMSYGTPESAMHAVLGNNAPTITSNGWQFWGCYSEIRDAWVPLEHIRAQLALHINVNATGENEVIKTSDTHPLRIDRVLLHGDTGQLGLTFCPGKCTKGLYAGTWQRDLLKDLNVIREAGATVLITLMESYEFELLGVPHFAQAVNDYNFRWMHLPIQDMAIPDENFEELWSTVKDEVHTRLQKGELIVIHCRGGLGRTGLIAARILVERGMQPLDAVKAIKSARENTIETYGQEEYVLCRRWEKTTQA